MQKTFRPYPSALILLTFALTFVFVFFATTGYWSGLVYSWAETNQTIRDSLLLSGPIASVISCALGALHRTVSFTAVPQRREYHLLFARIIPQFLAALFGWIIALLPLIVLTFARATFGTIDLSIVFTTILTWIIWTLGGYLLGTWMPFPASLLLSIVLGFLWNYLPSNLSTLVANALGSDFSFRSITPVWVDFGLGIGWQRTSTFAALITFFFSAVIFCLFWVGTKVKRLPIFLIPIALGGVIISVQPHLLEKDLAPHVCEVHSGVNLCLHPAQAAAFPALNQGVIAARDLIGANALPDSASFHTHIPSGATSLSLSARGNASEIAKETTAQLVDWAAGVWQCTLKNLESAQISDNSIGKPLSDEEQAIEAIQFSLVNKIGLSNYQDTLISEDKELEEQVAHAQQKIAQWSSAQAGQFIARNSARLRDCDPTLLTELK